MSGMAGVAICQWCLPNTGPNGLLQAAQMGFDGVEMDMGLNDPRRDLRDAAIFGAFLDAKAQCGIKTPSLALNYLGLNCEDTADYVHHTIDQTIAAAVQLEATTLQLCSFWHEGMRDETEFAVTVRALQYACRAAAPHGIAIASENQLDAAGNLRLIDAVGMENFGVYYDNANPYRIDHRDGMEMLRQLWPHVLETHIKDYTLDERALCMPLGDGDCRVAEALTLLRQHAYAGWLVVENEPDAARLAQDASYIRRVWQDA